jgi:glycosyltransferase involved in cell wall biosynthesis
MSALPVSVIIATRDRPLLLRAALDSILGQDYDGIVEAVVVYDQTDPDPTLAMDLGRRRVTVTTNTRTPGLAGARNSGVIASRGDLLAFCDDDDTWLPDKLALQADAMQRAGADVALTGIFVHYGDKVTVRIPDLADLTVAGLTRDRVMAAHPSTYVVTRAAFTDTIGFVDEAIPGSFGEDWDWLLRAVESARLVVVPRPLIRVLWHKGGSLFNRRWLTIIELADHHRGTGLHGRQASVVQGGPAGDGADLRAEGVRLRRARRP